jgi:polyphosphate kinase 2 (PPK2 family)
VRVAQFAAPTRDEKRHHFLWRFWPVLPGWGGMALLDRTWYGRVLVERVEGLVAEGAWRRAYAEIVGLETTLAAEGMVLVKFWMHVSPDEQLRRFQARRADPYKAWKLTEEDWRNRDRRAEYEPRSRRCWNARTPPARPGMSSRRRTSATPGSPSSARSATRSSERSPRGHRPGPAAGLI